MFEHPVIVSPRVGRFRIIRVVSVLLLGGLAVAPLWSRTTERKFSVKILPTIQKAVTDIWQKTPPPSGPQMAVATRIYRGQDVYLRVFTTGLTAGPEGRAEADYNISIYRPDGGADFTRSGLTLVAKTAKARNGIVYMAPEYLGWVADPDDPAGKWRIAVEATDLVGHVSARSEATFTLADKYVAEPLPKGTDAGRWMMAYHFNPQPQQVQAFLRYEAEHPPIRHDRPRPLVERGALLGFFEQVLADNSWLLPHLIAGYAQDSPAAKAQLAGLLAYAKRDDAKFAAGLPDELKKAVNRYRDTAWPVSSAEPLDGAQLDVLWGRFFASGAYQPLRDLVDVLAYHKFLPALKAYQQLAKKLDDVPIDVQKGAVFHAAAWSLYSNIKQDSLVRDYCEGMLQRKELPREEGAWLLSILKDAEDRGKKTAKPEHHEPGPIR